jgi:hypothetical protein
MKKKLRQSFLWIIRRPMTVVLICLTVISLITTSIYKFQGDHWKSICNADGAGYYAYLPATFIYQDFSFQFSKDIEKKYFDRDGGAYFLNYTEGVMVDKYYCGEAILLLPFFLLAWFLSFLLGFDCDGYSFLFQCSIAIGALFYVILGMHLLSRIALKYFSKYAVAAALGIIYLGSNLFYYTVFEPSCSHAFSFGAICIFIFLADKSLRLKTAKSFFLLVFCYSISVLIRPTNALILLLIPMLSGSWQNLRLWITSGFQPGKFIPILGIAISMLFIQSILYYLQCEKWWVDAYGNESFYFARPEILNVLFSYRVGFFVWAPAAILAIPGIYFLWKKNSMLGAFWILFMSISVWVIASWWCWHYEAAFGMRSLIDYIGLIMLATAAFFSSLKKWRAKILVAIIASTAILFTTLQTWQHHNCILPWEKISKEKYWLVFLKTDEKSKWLLSQVGQRKMPEQIFYLMQRRYWLQNKGKRISTENDFREDAFVRTIQYDGELERELIKMPLNTVQQQHPLFIELRCNVQYITLQNPAFLELQLFSKGKWIQSSGLRIIQPHFKCNQFNDFRLYLQTGHEDNRADEFRLVLRNEAYQPIEIRNISLTLASF